ncbi:hypothetical protein PQ478_07285 [Alkalihalophilus pseudofirmus]|uniref:hypothetical protein n=1 Tax=Alkalihalophilus pseudofirmus TaxID=79885 RepID=UPI00259BCA7B|nr:hypothetical protein [Alkalihalophilus pseudofirmus]WEG18276.1 hypothetical protein PQ478_07285 [Alkalihalophilus pseudofirmus]
MQKKQLKISDTSIRASEAFELEWDEMVIGNPSCYHKFMQPADIEFWVEYTNKKNITLVVELPVVFQSHLEALIDFVRVLINKYHIKSFIINDFGMLYEMNRFEGNSLNIRLGQLLNYNQYNSPWSDRSLKHELENIKVITKESSLEAESILDLITLWNVCEVEVNLNTISEKEKIKYQRYGVTVSGVVNAQLLAVSRSCHAVRLFDGEVGSCQSLCNKPLNLEALYKWERYDDQLKRMSLETRNSLSSLKLVGNSIWLGKSLSGRNIDLLNTVSFDLRVQEPQVLIENYSSLFSKKVLT